MAEIKIVTKENLLYIWQKIKLKLSGKVDKVEGMGLSHNDLTDELKQKILTAGDSSFTGNYDDLTNKPDLTVFAKTTDVNTAINSAVANINKKEIVTSISEMTDVNTIYLIANEGTVNNIYDEYIVVNGTPEKVGTTEVDLTGYAKKNDFVAVTNSEIDEMFVD